MKKVLSLILLGLLLSTAAYAVSDNPTALTATLTQANVNYEGQSNFGAIGAWGNTSTGNPGYLVLKGCNASNVCFPYYFWVASDGNLYQASYLNIVAFSSFPSGNWNRSNFLAGSKVGSQ